jgi:hypothetical protein
MAICCVTLSTHNTRAARCCSLAAVNSGRDTVWGPFLGLDRCCGRVVGIRLRLLPCRGSAWRAHKCTYCANYALSCCFSTLYRFCVAPWLRSATASWSDEHPRRRKRPRAFSCPRTRPRIPTKDRYWPWDRAKRTLRGRCTCRI